MLIRARSVLARHPFRWFYGLSLLLSLLLLVPFLLFAADERIAEGFARSGLAYRTDLITAARVIWAVPATLPGFLLAFSQILAPDIMAFVVVALVFGRSGVRRLAGGYRLWNPSVPWRRGATVWLHCIFTFVGLSLITALLHSVLLPTAQFEWSPPHLTLSFLGTLLVAMFLDIGGIAEETGWRGFALPYLQSRFTPLRATLILGTLWGLWHLPLKADWLSIGVGHAVLMLLLFTLRLTLLSVIMSYFYNRLGGSTLIAIAMHGLHNDSVQLQGIVDFDQLPVGQQFTVEGALTLPIAAVAAYLIWRTRSQLAYSPKEVPPEFTGNEALQAQTPSSGAHVDLAHDSHSIEASHSRKGS
ncbi:CPBP family intramembrane glutamic endopeptidase [Deinococcus sp. Arct2-2]|uniref:CPBP family intramembrane glutamic endopeptidase n=1 Tax=Deinococcus sp. Arct2-2 TaxID=2568653 RepID=UPI001454CF36|nr:CPBP family intramembrane glutamic endopeptidase [Deinococcus sp. Arct2-2]